MKMKKKPAFDPDCKKCEAKCCTYIAMSIDKPTCKSDYDNIRWYLLHKDVHVFKDYDNDWYIEFKTKCKELGKNNRCKVYKHRPEICKDHGVVEEECEFYGDVYKLFFDNVKDFETHIKKSKRKRK